ncbi:MAG: MarR family winged helix-turn-helix transcriptional regulator [Planctomycetota bacterium]
MKDPIRDCVGFRLAAAHRRLDRLFNRTYASLGLSHAHGQILLCIFERGEARMSEIVASTGLAQSTVSRLTKELSRQRYLRREKDPADARAQLLSPGKRAISLKDELYSLQDRINTRIRHELAGADVERLFDELDRIAPRS